MIERPIAGDPTCVEIDDEEDFLERRFTPACELCSYRGSRQERYGSALYLARQHAGGQRHRANLRQAAGLVTATLP